MRIKIQARENNREAYLNPDALQSGSRRSASGEELKTDALLHCSLPVLAMCGVHSKENQKQITALQENDGGNTQLTYKSRTYQCQACAGPLQLLTEDNGEDIS